MPIYEGSRYEGSRFTTILASDGTVRKYVHPRLGITVDDLQGDFQVVGKITGDELDQIAEGVDGGKERLWWLVAEPSGVFFPWDIPDGTDLVIPSPRQFARLSR